MKLHIVMYHYVRDLADSRYPNIKGLDLKYFREQIDFLQSRFTFTSAEALLEMRAGGKAVPENSVLLTFDDGYIDHYTNVFPLLHQKGISAIFSMPGKILAEGKLLDVNKIHFILASANILDLREALFTLLDRYRGREYQYPDKQTLYRQYAVANRFDDKDTIFVKRILQFALPEDLRNKLAQELFSMYVPLSEKAFAKELYMSMDQIRLMKSRGMHFAIHGYDHYWLGEMTENAMQQDIERALDVFDGVLDRNNWIMCYPYGSYNDQTLATVAGMKGKIGLTSQLAVANIPTDNWLTLPRLDTNDYPPKSEKYLSI